MGASPGLVCAVEAAMTDDEKTQFLAVLDGLNPHMRGCPVADYLDMLDECDARLDVTEPMFEQHGTDPILLGLPPHSLTVCTLAVLYSHDDAPWAEVQGMLSRLADQLAART